MSVLFVPQVRKFLSTSLVVTVNIPSKRDASNETIESSNGEEIEKISMDLPIYANTQFFIKKGRSLTWQQIKFTFA